MSTLERGFKSWAERTSLAFRKELGVSIEHPLEPEVVAEYLDVQLWTPDQVPGMTQDILNQLLKLDPWGWSAAGVQVQDHGVVIYNPRHSRPRQVSDIMHELAHFILDHQPAQIILSADLDGLTMRSFNPKQEDEANCVAWSLLLPRDGLLWAKRRRLTLEQIAQQYAVTKSLATYRLNTTGVEKQLRARSRFVRRTAH
jgi:Zn-dependent peptidase ImmA (M78 family)